MLVECFERPDEDPTVLQYTAHPVVDVLKHLTALPDRLDGHTETHTHILRLFCTSVRYTTYTDLDKSFGSLCDRVYQITLTMRSNITCLFGKHT